MRVYYDQRGHVRGYSVPLWFVVVKWVLIIGVIVAPIYGLAHLLGINSHSPVVTVVALVWLCAWLALPQYLRHQSRR